MSKREQGTFGFDQDYPSQCLYREPKDRVWSKSLIGSAISGLIVALIAGVTVYKVGEISTEKRIQYEKEQFRLEQSLIEAKLLRSEYNHRVSLIHLSGEETVGELRGILRKLLGNSLVYLRSDYSKVNLIEILSDYSEIVNNQDIANRIKTLKFLHSEMLYLEDNPRTYISNSDKNRQKLIDRINSIMKPLPRVDLDNI